MSLTTIDFGQVNTIGERAFSQCISLTTIDFGQVNTIGEVAFGQCSSLREVRLNFDQDWNIPTGVFFDNLEAIIPVVDGTAENPFLVHKNITSISFETSNGVFSNKSTEGGGLVLVDYDDEYNRVVSNVTGDTDVQKKGRDEKTKDRLLND